jgi:hypothetical protein
MATEDKYGQQLQAWFEDHAGEGTDGASAYEAQQAIGCSRQRVYQWLATGAVDVVETGEMSTRGAKLYRYMAGTKDRSTAGRGRRAVKLKMATDETPMMLAAGLIGHTLSVVGMRLAGHGLVLDCRDEEGQEVALELV